MLTIIQDILDIAALEKGYDKYEYKESLFNVKELVKSVTDILDYKARAKGIKIYIQCPNVDIISDRSKVRQILINLISNSIKYTDIGKIMIEVELLDNKVYFSVNDTGKGIDPMYHKSIFEPFVQLKLDNGLTKEGVGLGLAISKRLVEKMNGKIWVHSEKDKGTSFKFYIPQEKVDLLKKYNRVLDVDCKTIIKNIKSENNKNILVVEDDETSRNVIIDMLIRLGFTNILYAKDGQEALDIVNNKNNKIKIILMDMYLPIIDGFKASREIKKNDNLKDIPIIAVTAYAREEDKTRCLSVGCDDYISKPYTIDDITVKLKKYAII